MQALGDQLGSCLSHLQRPRVDIDAWHYSVGNAVPAPPSRSQATARAVNGARTSRPALPRSGGSCSSTSRPRAWIRAAATRSGPSSASCQREGTTLLLTTQYLEEADQLADRIAVIDRGKVIAEGTGNELKNRIGGQILEVELSSAAQRDRAQAVLAGVGCGEPEPDERPDRLTLPAPRNGLQLVEEAAAELRRAQIGVSDIGLRRATLDDVFLQLTGAPPGEDGGGPGPRTPRRPRTRQQPAPDVPAPRRPVLRLRRPPPRAVRSAVTDTAVVTGRNGSLPEPYGPWRVLAAWWRTSSVRPPQMPWTCLVRSANARHRGRTG